MDEAVSRMTPETNQAMRQSKTLTMDWLGFFLLGH